MDTLPIYKLAVQPRHGELTTALPHDEVRSGDCAWVVRMVGDSPAFDIMRWKADYLSDRGTGGMGYINIRNPVATWRDMMADAGNRCLVPTTTSQWPAEADHDRYPTIAFHLTRQVETMSAGVWWHEGSVAYFGILATCERTDAPIYPVLLRGERARTWLTADIYDVMQHLPIDVGDAEQWRPERLQQARIGEAERLSNDRPF